MLRAISHLPPGHSGPLPFDVVVLNHDERRLRRKLLRLVHGDEVLVDLPNTVTLESKSALLLEDGRTVGVEAGEEALYEVRGRDRVHLMQLCWHLGNRHLPTQIESEWEGLGDRILILRDHVIRDMLLGLGASVTEVSEPFHPVHGAYHGHAHGHGDHALLNRK
jgi:urease accessory protein